MKDQSIPSDESLLFAYSVHQIAQEDPSVLTKLFFIRETDPNNIVNGPDGNQISTPIDALNFDNFTKTTLNFNNNQIVYDGNIANLNLQQKEFSDMINDFPLLTTLESIWDPMKTSKKNYDTMNEMMKTGVKFEMFSYLTHKVFNETENMVCGKDSKTFTIGTELSGDDLSAFSTETRKLFNMCYFETNDDISMGLVCVDRARYNRVFNSFNKDNKPDFIKILECTEKKYNGCVYNSYTETNKSISDANVYIAFDIRYQHIASFQKDSKPFQKRQKTVVQHLPHKKETEINSIKNIEYMIKLIENKKIQQNGGDKRKRESDGNIFRYFQDYMVDYIYQNPSDKENAIRILFDLKKSGDYGKVLLCFYNNLINDQKFMLISNDRLCALNGILRKNINVMFGTTRPKLFAPGNEKHLCFYTCCNDKFTLSSIKLSLEITFGTTISSNGNSNEEDITLQNYKQSLQTIHEMVKECCKKKVSNFINKNIKGVSIQVIEYFETIILKDFFNNVQNKSISTIEDLKNNFQKFIRFSSDIITVYETIILDHETMIKMLNDFVSSLDVYPKILSAFSPKGKRASSLKSPRGLDDYINNQFSIYRESDGNRELYVDNAANIIIDNYIKNKEIKNAVFQNLEKLLSFVSMYIGKINSTIFDDDMINKINGLYKTNLLKIGENIANKTSQIETTITELQKYNELETAFMDMQNILDQETKVDKNAGTKLQFISETKALVNEKIQIIQTRIKSLKNNIQVVQNKIEQNLTPNSSKTPNMISYSRSFITNFTSVASAISRKASSIFKTPLMKIRKSIFSTSKPSTIQNTIKLPPTQPPMRPLTLQKDPEYPNSNANGPLFEFNTNLTKLPTTKIQTVRTQTRGISKSKHVRRPSISTRSSRKTRQSAKSL